MRASLIRESGSFDGSAIWNRRIPFRATQPKTRLITSSPAGTHEMKRIPVVMKLSGVSGIASLTRRIRSQGSSWWKRTETAMWVLDVKSRARKPTRSMVGAMSSTSGVVSPVALQRLWLPSLVVVSTISTRSSLIALDGAEGVHHEIHRRLTGGGLGLCGLHRHRARLEHEQLAASSRDRPLDVLMAAEVALDRPS